MGHHKSKKGHFKAWYITLPITLLAFAAAGWFWYALDAAMAAEENPWGAIAEIMIFSYYIGIALLVGIVLGIVTIVLVVKKK